MLTIQRTERAAALIYACEFLRRRNKELGDDEISIGLWVGWNVTTNSRKEALEIIEKIKNDRYYFGDLASPTIGQIKGRPIVLVDAMPDIAANATPIAYADLKKGYTIVDQPSSTAVTVNTNPMLTVGGSLTDMTGKAVSYRFFRHVGGDVVDPQAFVKMKIAE